VRVSLFITSPEGELSETAMLIPTGGPDVYPPEVRTQLENMVADCLEQADLSAAEAIEQIDVPHLGGHWVPEPADVIYAVQVLGEGLAVNAVWDALKLGLKQLFGTPSPGGDSRAELRAMFAIEGDQVARSQIEQAYGVPEADLKAISTGFHGSNGLFVYDSDDGSTFIVNVDAAEGVLLHIVRKWPTGPAVAGSNSNER